MRRNTTLLSTPRFVMSNRLLAQTVRTHRKQLLVLLWTLIVFLTVYWVLVSLTDTVSRELVAQTQPLVGADILVESSVPFEDTMLETFARYEIEYGLRSSYVTSLSTTLISETVDPALVSVLWVDENYPLYGALEVQQLGWDQDKNSDRVILDQETFAQYATNWTIAIWSLTVPVSWTLSELPTVSLGVFDEWRTLLIDRDLLERTWLTWMGSRVSYEYQLALPANQQSSVWSESDLMNSIIEQLRAEPVLRWRVEVENWARRIAQIASIITEFDRFIRTVLLATMALILLTIMIGVRTFFVREQRTIWILRLLGQTSWAVQWLYRAVFGVCFWVAALCAMWLVLLSPALFAPIIDSLAVSSVYWVTGQTLGEIAIIAVVVALATLIPSLLQVTTQPALALLSPQAQTITQHRWLIGLVTLTSLTVIYMVTIWWWIAMGITLVVFVLFTLLYYGVMSGALRLLQGLSSNLYKRVQTNKWFMRYDWVRATRVPGNQSLLISIWLFVSLAVIGTVWGITWSFLSTLEEVTQAQPWLYVLNVLEDDTDYITQTYPDSTLYDIILSRIISVDATSPASWEFDREFNATSITFNQDDYLEWSAPQPWEVSLEAWFAERLWAEVWSTIEFFIQWRTLPLQVTSLRREAQRTQWPFFYVQFSTEQFADAPRQYFWTVDIGDQPLGEFKRSIVQELWPYLTFIDTTALIDTVRWFATTLTTVIIILVSVLSLLVLLAIFISLDSMRQLRVFKERIYRMLWATGSMLRTSAHSELSTLLWVSFTLAVLFSIAVVWYAIYSSEFLTW